MNDLVIQAKPVTDLDLKISVSDRNTTATWARKITSGSTCNLPHWFCVKQAVTVVKPAIRKNFRSFFLYAAAAQRQLI